jgi:hypothetical protein
MRTKWLLGLLLVVAGCGGGGNSAVIANPFAGTWLGPWQTPAEDGTMNVTVGTNGQLTGTSHHNQLNLSGTISGSVNNSGGFATTTVYPGFQPVMTTGTVSFNQQGHLLGNGTDNLIFDLIRL